MSLDKTNQLFGEPIIWRSQPLTGGLNNRYQAQYIKDDQASELFNVDLDDVTRPKMRDGYLILGNSLTEMQDGLNATLKVKRIAGLTYLHTTFNTQKMFIAIDNGASDGNCYVRSDVSASGAWVQATVTTSPFFLSVNTADCVAFQVNDGLLVIPEASVEVHSMDSAGLMYAGGNTNTSPPKGAVDGCAFLSRAWLLKQGTASNPPELHYSKLLPGASSVATNWGRDGSTVSPLLAGRLQLAADRGGLAVACKPWNEVSIMVFFNNCIEEILVFNANPQGGSIRRVIEDHIGCSSRDSVISVGQEMFFADQFGQIRSLQQTVSAAQAGVAPAPLSEPIAGELPGKLNLQYRSKIRCMRFQDRLFVAYPRLGATEANAVAVYHLGRKIWESIWILHEPVGRWLVSDIRGSGNDLWFSDGSTGAAGGGMDIGAKIYRLYSQTYSDNGAPITYTETTKAFDIGVPEADKIWDGYEADARGSNGVIMETAIRFDEDSGFHDLEGSVVISKPGGSFPILASDFPLLPADFPLVQGATKLARKRQSLYGVTGADSDDAPESRSRTAQLQITSINTGKQFQRAGYRLWCRVQKNEGIDWLTENTPTETS